ncbi:unnamed protein product [Notodromas monacha]|uniref:Uncharacterized protein n=1 Tax=Notodromas monacha TaxID=399045 RepID=A0A7R9GDG1_9CRUS|nr:unnamed protein product [Notodromas monacha]CAG0918504.1 unnamed protein product [Notodromas monacha]
MPRKKCVENLQTIAMNNIAKNFEKICYGLQDSQLFALIMEDDAYLNFASPFKELAPVLLDEFFELLCERRTVSRHMLHMVFNENNRIVRLRQGMGEIYYAIRFLMDRCKVLDVMPMVSKYPQHIAVLDLSYMHQMGPQDLMKLFQPLTTLIQVNLRGTLTVTEVVSIIATNCENLAELNLSETAINDKSIQALYRTKQVDGTLVKHAQKLRRLVLADVSVTPFAVASALQSLPSLCEVDYSALFQVFSLLPSYVGYGSFGEAVGLEKFQLNRIASTREFISHESIEVATQTCPNIQSITLLECSGIDNEGLMKFMAFERLTHLSITNDDDRTLDFFEGVLPILQARGEQMQNLILTDFLVVNIDALASACPNLQNLALSGITDYHYTSPEELVKENMSRRLRRISEDDVQGNCSSSNVQAAFAGASIGAFVPHEYCFTKLKALEIWSAPGHPGPSKEVIVILMKSSQNLEHLLLQGCVHFDDGVFAQIVKLLSHITTNECSISTEVFRRLLDSDNNLDMIRIWSCPGIDREGYEEIRQRIKDDNLEIYLDWFA